ncbi:MAG TPA: hypothetical protein VF203_03790 [Burkholderiales bacterium]
MPIRISLLALLLAVAALVLAPADEFIDLGDLPGGGYYSTATGVSADGSVIVGYSQSVSGQEAFRWTQADGMKSLAELLTAAGVDLAGWTLTRATGVSADGSVIVGEAKRGGDTVAYVAKVSSNSGLIMPEELAASLNARTAPTQQSQRAVTTGLSRLLFAASPAVPAAPGRTGDASEPTASLMVGIFAGL